MLNAEGRMYRAAFDDDGLRDGFLKPIPEIFEAAILLDKAVDAHLQGSFSLAERLLRRADMPTIGAWLDSIWLGGFSPVRAIRKISGLPPVVPKELRHQPRDATRDMKRALIARDGHHCRFCSIPLVRPEVRKELNRLYPDAARWTSARETDQHRGLQVLWLQYDHIIVHSRGGETSMDNIVVACAACNYGRDRFMLAEVGLRDPRLHVRTPTWPGRLTWDGLERLLPENLRFVQDQASPFKPA
jgi:5-methylcytosine-specific restriction endonuclease McrA